MITSSNGFDEESLGIGLMSVVQIRSFHECFRECQHSEPMRPGEKELGKGCGGGMHAGPRLAQLLFSPFLQDVAIIKSSYDPAQTYQGILHINSVCKRLPVQPK